MNLRRILVLTLACLTLVLAVPDAQARKVKRRTAKAPQASSRTVGRVTDPRYADIIMNPVTGEIYHATDADGKRYPASLTKMMTLYLLFEALEQRKVTLNTKMDVSDYASTMPQTNLALEPGDTIPVDIAIKALVVRSANDVAVVVAEHLSGDVEEFAEKMTAKARALGMRSTVFRNPNGLPNSGQYTTARDMAKLGIALKRDFPKYYPYFSTRQFSWNGATYYTHNRVMLRYSGTDGIKTGFIGASGFNVVSSVTRGGRPLVGTVMGGSSGVWRDNRMIQLLDQSYKIVASRGATPGQLYPENLPNGRDGTKPSVPRGKIAVTSPIPATNTDHDKEEAALVATLTAPAEPVSSIPEGAAEDEDVPPITSNHAKPANATKSAPPALPAAASPFAYASPPAASVPSAATPTSATTASISASSTPAVAASTNPWGIQVGAYSSAELAEKAANQAYQLATAMLSGARMGIAGPESGGAPVYRARLINLTEYQAKTACEKLISNSTPCFIFKAGM